MNPAEVHRILPVQSVQLIGDRANPVSLFVILEPELSSLSGALSSRSGKYSDISPMSQASRMR